MRRVRGLEATPDRTQTVHWMIGFFQTTVFTANKPKFFSAGVAGLTCRGGGSGGFLCLSPAGDTVSPGDTAWVRHRLVVAQPWVETVGLEEIMVAGPPTGCLLPAGTVPWASHAAFCRTFQQPSEAGTAVFLFGCVSNPRPASGACLLHPEPVSLSIYGICWT